MKKTVWIVWGALTLLLVGFFAYTLLQSDDKEILLIGEATYGHYQIEMACSTCHTDAFGGEEAIQEACVGCHQDELDAAHDSHPKKKFTDPRNADRLEILDARYCVTCHTEHQKEQTHPMGVTIPEDYCFHCHQEIGEERESHAGLGYESCASAGCHNYHDNRALYERFLVEHASEPWLKEMQRITGVAAVTVTAHAKLEAQPSLQRAPTDGPLPDSEHFLHGEKGVGCVACHQADNSLQPAWVASPQIEACQQCHVNEVKGYQEGRHGMRLAQNLEAITPGQTDGNFHSDASMTEQGCNSCHVAHEYNTDFASTEACLGCHADEHSLAFKTSAHAGLSPLVDGQDQGDGETILSCASCHMPRVEMEVQGEKVWAVEHNQNMNLRPNEKMIRSVCMDCHSLQFSLNALADAELIRNNFAGQPSVHVESIDWAVKREQEK